MEALDNILFWLRWMYIDPLQAVRTLFSPHLRQDVAVAKARVAIVRANYSDVDLVAVVIDTTRDDSVRSAARDELRSRRA